MAKEKAKKFGQLAYEYIRKKLVKPSKGGITSLPTEKEITNEMLQMFEKLRGAGYNVTNIGKEVRTPDDLGFLINRIEQAELNQSKQFLDSAEALETIQYKLNNNIPLNPNDQKKLLGKGFKTASEAFQGFTPKVIQGGKPVEVKLPKSAKKDMLESYDNLFLKGEDTKYDADVLATDLAERRGFIKEGQDSTDMDQKKYSDLYSEAYSFLTELRFLNRPPRKQSKESTVKNVAEAMFGPIGKKEEGIKSLDLAKELEELTNKNLKERGLGEIKLGDKLPPPKKKKPAVDPELKKSEDTKKMIKDFEERNERALEDFVDDAGGTKEGVEFDDEPFDAAKGGIARVGFEKGGMSRRTFLKLLGGLASIPVVGKFLKPAAKATKAVEVASKSSGVPAYFPKLVEKIQLLGDDVTKVRATKEREIVKEYKGYELTEDLDTGKLTVKRDNYTSEEYLQFEPAGQYYDETRKKVIKYPDEYEEVTVKPDYEGKMKDVDYGLDNIDEIMREVDMIKTDYKMAPGGKPRDKKSGGGLAYMMGE